MSTTLQQSEEALRSQDYWASGALPSFETIKVEEDGSFGGIIAGSVCGLLEDGKAKALLISSLSVRKVEGEHIIPGYGRVTSSFIADNLNTKKRSLQANLVAAHDLPESCQEHFAQDDILSVRKIDLPEVFQPQSTRIDYRAEACPEGQSGHIVKMVQTVHSKGNVEYQLDESTTQNLCRVEKNLNRLSSREADLQGVTLSGVSASSSNLAATISNGFAGKKCREVDLYSKPRTARDIDNDPAPLDSYETCTGGLGITISSADWLNNLAEDRARVDCSSIAPGQAASACLADDRLCGDLRANPWSGSGSLYRQPIDIKANHWTAWEGTTLQCERSEELIIDCLDLFPWARDLIPLSANNGWLYSRQTTISGWDDPVRLVPNKSQSTRWVEQQASGCSWEETRVLDQSCGANSSDQQMRITERRVFRASSPTAGAWSEWEEVSREGECNAPCDLPWGGTIEHGRYVPAFAKTCDYTDSATWICPRMLRECNNGTLEGPSDYNMQTCPKNMADRKTLCPGVLEKLEAVRYKCDSPKGPVYFALDSLVTSWNAYAHWSALGINEKNRAGWITDSETCQDPNSGRFGTARNNCVFFAHGQGHGRTVLGNSATLHDSRNYKSSQGARLPYYVTPSTGDWQFPTTFQTPLAGAWDCHNYPLRDGITPQMCTASYTCTLIE